MQSEWTIITFLEYDITNLQGRSRDLNTYIMMTIWILNEWIVNYERPGMHDLEAHTIAPGHGHFLKK